MKKKFPVANRSVNEHEEAAGLVRRLRDDRAYVAVDKKPIALCELLREKATVDGLASFDLQSHLLTPKVRPADT